MFFYDDRACFLRRPAEKKKRALALFLRLRDIKTTSLLKSAFYLENVVCHVKRVRKDEEEKTVKSRRTNHTGVQNRCILKQRGL